LAGYRRPHGKIVPHPVSSFRIEKVLMRWGKRKEKRKGIEEWLKMTTLF